MCISKPCQTIQSLFNLEKCKPYNPEETMKKNFVLLLCFILAMGMVSCGDDKLDEAIDTEQGGDDGKDDGDDGDDGEKPEPAKAVSWFVAPNGNDSSNGMIATPLKTIPCFCGKVCIMSM